MGGWSHEKKGGARPLPADASPRPRLLDEVRGRLRRLGLARRTEEAYVGWIRRFILANGRRHPRRGDLRHAPAAAVPKPVARAGATYDCAPDLGHPRRGGLRRCSQPEPDYLKKGLNKFLPSCLAELLFLMDEGLSTPFPGSSMDPGLRGDGG
jgi:hypothetical protein